MSVKLTSRLPKVIAKAQVEAKAANAASARRIAAQASARAPRATGALAGSIKAEADGVTDSRVNVGEWYGHLVEFGTVNNPAHPFLVPAAEAERLPHRRAIREVFRP